MRTSVTEDGLIVDSSNSVIGYKCMQCSTAHLLEGEARYDVQQAAAAISAWQDTHAACGELVAA